MQGIYNTKKAASDAVKAKLKQNRVLAKQGELPTEYIIKYISL